jgi:hypothetical protein
VFRGHGRLLTPPRPRGDTRGWSGLQITAPAGERTKEEHLLFAYRLDDGAERRRFPLGGLEPGGTYEVEQVTGEPERRTASGRELAAEGIEVKIDRRFDARVLRVRPYGARGSR